MQGKSIFNGKVLSLSQIDALTYFVDCVATAMISMENSSYLSFLHSKFVKSVESKINSDIFNDSLLILKFLCPNSRGLNFTHEDRSIIGWNTFKYDQNLDRFVGNLSWQAPKVSGAFIKVIFDEKCTYMFYCTGHVYDAFGKHTPRGSCEELKLPRKGDEILSSYPPDSFRKLVETLTQLN